MGAQPAFGDEAMRGENAMVSLQVVAKGDFAATTDSLVGSKAAGVHNLGSDQRVGVGSFDLQRDRESRELAGSLAAVFDIGLFRMDLGVVRGHDNRVGEDIG